MLKYLLKVFFCKTLSILKDKTFVTLNNNEILMYAGWLQLKTKIRELYSR